jgi:hypothetical protein
VVKGKHGCDDIGRFWGDRKIVSARLGESFAKDTGICLAGHRSARLLLSLFERSWPRIGLRTSGQDSEAVGLIYAGKSSFKVQVRPE